MRRFLTLWLTLLAAFWLTRTLVSAFLFGHAGLGREAVWSLLVVPPLQTAVLLWLTRAPGPWGAALAPWRELWGFRRVRALLALDLLAIGLAVGTALHGGAAPVLATLPDLYTGVKLALAALAAIALAVRGKGLGDSFAWLSLWGRARLLAAAVALAAYASAYFSDGLGRFLELALGELPEELPWVLFGLLAALGLGLLVSVRPLFARRLPPAALALDAGIGLALAAGLGTLLGALSDSPPAEPWNVGTHTLALLSATFLLAGVASTALPRRPVPEAE